MLLHLVWRHSLGTSNRCVRSVGGVPRIRMPVPNLNLRVAVSLTGNPVMNEPPEHQEPKLSLAPDERAVIISAMASLLVILDKSGEHLAAAYLSHAYDVFASERAER